MSDEGRRNEKERGGKREREKNERSECDEYTLIFWCCSFNEMKIF